MHLDHDKRIACPLEERRAKTVKTLYNNESQSYGGVPAGDDFENLTPRIKSKFIIKKTMNLK